MRIIRSIKEFQLPAKPVCLAIGVFDGVHLGHQTLLNRCVAAATSCSGVSVVVTFDRHPNSTVNPQKTPPLISTLSQRLESIESSGIDTLCLIPFDEEFAKISGRDFVHELTTHFDSLNSIFLGSDFHFGNQRSGNARLLQEMGQSLNFKTVVVPPSNFDNRIISSTRIREAIQAGALDDVSAMLDRPYILRGTIIRGNQLGRTLGFPTANLDVSGMALPPSGVYAVIANVHGEKIRGVLNLGYRPSIHQPTRSIHCEVHLLNFERDIYGAEIDIDWVAKLREEQKFDGLDRLVAQIRADVEAAKVVFQD